MNIIKRLIDMIGSLLGLIVLTPLFILIGIAIKIDSRGPVFFKQERVGKGGQIFTMYKFRSMRVDAEKTTGPVWAKKNDPRVTKLGRFLRKTRLDELPQLLNILVGEMSLVGPRPERPVFVREFSSVISGYGRRLDVKPGLTGLAQVRYRYDQSVKDVKNKLRYDLIYIKNMCLLLDLRIMFKTFRVVLNGAGAH
ncbi:MAG: sugar transferase [bacterium]|nr:sugar transferase [bacterium]